MVDRTLVRKYLGGLEPVGTHLLLDERDVEIVGVVGEVRHFALDEEPLATLYLPATQLQPDIVPYFTSRAFVAVRAPGLPASALREALREVDASVPADVRQLEEMLGAALAPLMFQAFVMLMYAGAVLVLAGSGPDGFSVGWV